MISIIIPTLNEEKNILRVISQFKSISDLEIIIADGSSEDNTIKIAKKLGAKIYQNKRNEQNIAKNRNLGAKHARGDMLIFCDADTRFKNPIQAINKIKSVFQNKEILGGIVKLDIFPKEKKTKDYFFHSLYNLILKKSFKTKKPLSPAQCHIIRAAIFKKIRGYNPNLTFGEDTEIFRRIIKYGKVGYLDTIVLYESPRRYRKKGYIYLGAAALFAFLIRKLFQKEAIKTWERVE